MTTEDAESTRNISSSSSSGEDEDDEDALMRMDAFRSAAGAASDRGGSFRSGTYGSLRRFDEFGNFLTRSERAHQLGKDPPLTPDEQRMHKVHMKVPHEVDAEYELPELTDEDKGRCYMTSTNWSAIDLDVELTKKRWQNHLDGAIPFDETNNTLRGLESMFDPDMRQRPWMKEHQINVLQEMNRQKEKHEFPDWEKLRQASFKTSNQETERVKLLAEKDAEEAIRCWKLAGTLAADKKPSKQPKGKGRGAGTKNGGFLLGIFRGRKGKS